MYKTRRAFLIGLFLSKLTQIKLWERGVPDTDILETGDSMRQKRQPPMMQARVAGSAGGR